MSEYLEIAWVLFTLQVLAGVLSTATLGFLWRCLTAPDDPGERAKKEDRKSEAKRKKYAVEEDSVWSDDEKYIEDLDVAKACREPNYFMGVDLDAHRTRREARSKLKAHVRRREVKPKAMDLEHFKDAMGTPPVWVSTTISSGGIPETKPSARCRTLLEAMEEEIPKYTYNPSPSDARNPKPKAFDLDHFNSRYSATGNRLLEEAREHMENQ